MQKKFVSNLFLMVLLNLLVKPAAIFGVDAAVQNRVGAEDYGIYFALLNFSFLFNIFLDFGVNNYTTKNVAQYPALARKYLSKVFSFRLFLFIIYALVTFGIALLLDYNGEELYFLSILAVNQLFVALIAYVRSHLGGFMLFKTEAIVGVLDRFLLIIFCFYALYISSEAIITIEWFIWMQFYCYLITLFIGLVILFKRLGLPKLQLQPKVSMVIIRQSFPYALLILLMMIYTRTDSVMLEQIHVNGEKESGYYAQGFRLINALFLFAMLFSNLLFPLFSKMLRDKEDIAPLLSMSAKLLIGGSAGLAILAFFNSEFILGLIYTRDVYHSAGAFQLLMISFVGMCITIVFGTLLTAQGNLAFLNIISSLGILINIGLNIVLIPEHGAYGAAIATVFTQLLVAIVQLIYVIRTFQLKWMSRQLIFFPAYLISLIVLCSILPITSLPLLFLLAFMIPVLMTIFQLIDLRGIGAILRTDE